MANSLNKITTKSILDATVATADIADDAVTNAKIADNAIEGNQIAAGEVSAAKLASNSVTGAKIADDAVGSEHIEVLDAALQFGDSVKAQFGAGNDLELFHDGSHSYIKDTGTGGLWVYSNDFNVTSANGAENIIKGTENGAVSLYYDNVKTFETKANGIAITGTEGASADIKFYADEGDDNADKWYQYASTDGQMNWQSYTSGSWVTKFEIRSGGDIKVNNGNILMGAAGTGINFSATADGSGGSNVNEVLDDYEEGTFTPTVYGATTAGSTTYTQQVGYYTKVGRSVIVTGNVYNSTTGGAGTYRIGGMPFTCTGEATGTFQCNDMTQAYQTDVGQYTSLIQDTETNVHFRGTKNNGDGFVYLQIQNMNYLRFTICYNTTQ